MQVTVTIDRPMGSFHPQHKNLYYPINYGYIEGIIGGDGEYQDAYVIGVDIPLSHFTGKVIAIIHRFNDNEDKWVIAPISKTYWYYVKISDNLNYRICNKRCFILVSLC